MTVRPKSPNRRLPTEKWEHYGLYGNVKDAISALPAYFRTETFISGIAATDIHTLNTALGATIEDQVVTTLNSMRRTWDPDAKYALYSFVRQPQTFPDVRLRQASDNDTILGIELKGWYLLAKEGEPSLRFQVSANACADADLVAIVPWVLANVISGSPIVFDPYIESARYAAEYRNYHWKYVRKTNKSTNIELATDIHPYPVKLDEVSDKAEYDKGDNFGRLGRTNLMDDYCALIDERFLCGVKIPHWRAFFKAFIENATDERIKAALTQLGKKIGERQSSDSSTTQVVSTILEAIQTLLNSSDG